MRFVEGLSVALLLGGSLFAQAGGFSNRGPAIRGSFGNVVYPGGTSATTPGLTRFPGNVVYPGGGGPQAGSQNFRRPIGQTGRSGRGTGQVVAIPYAYPVYVGGYGYNYGYGYGYPPDAGYAPDAYSYAPDAGYAAPQQPQQPNVIVIYAQGPPPMPAPSAPAPPAANQAPPEDSDQSPVGILDPSHYLIAFKDHTIYSAMAYWVEGDTLHYFTSGNTHNQVSLDLVDRALTDRLNKESGVDMHLPADPAAK